jgi:hypothetical protein
MRRIAWGLVVAVAALAGCGYPGFDFSTSKTTTGKTTSTTTSTGAGGAPPTVRVECMDAGVACAASESCCYHETQSACDHCSDHGLCGSTGGCGNNYFPLECVTAADCAGGGVCCGTLAEAEGGGKVIQGSTCVTELRKCQSPTQFVFCKEGDDGAECGGKACLTLSYGTYAYCEK